VDLEALTNRGFRVCANFTRIDEREVLAALPTDPGVYAILLAESQHRRRGESDISYIGRAVNQNGLRGRVRQYFHPGPTQSTNIDSRYTSAASLRGRKMGRNPRLAGPVSILSSPVLL
jgi:hypothetical protein